MDLNDIGVKLPAACGVLVVDVKVSVRCAVLVGSVDDVKLSLEVLYFEFAGAVDKVSTENKHLALRYLENRCKGVF